MTLTGRPALPDASHHRGAQIRHVPPPLYYGAAFGAGMLLRGGTGSLAIGAEPPTVAVGGLVLAAGAALALGGVAGVVQHRTTIVPHHAVSTLVTTGAYRVSRNPMYAGLAIAYLGASLLAGSWWPVATLPLAVLAIRRLVIEPEERYLESKFDQTYSDYRARVRRWV